MATPSMLADALLQPISDQHPAGEDLGYSAEFDAIREARRSDPPGLSQGEWETELKVADWPAVRDRCEALLRTRTKDLLLACWYAEAQTRVAGFSGLATGAALVSGLLRDFWTFCYPPLDPEDLDERTGRIEWLSVHVTAAIQTIPLTAPHAGGHTWLQWQQSRALDNLALRDQSAWQAAVDAGALTGEAFDKAARASGLAFYTALVADVREAIRQLEELVGAVDLQFGAQAPSLRPLLEAARQCLSVVERCWQACGGSASVPVEAKPAPSANAPTAAPAPAPAAAAHAPAPGVTGAELLRRADAVAQLHRIAAFFRTTEPHSPVALLVERAARWADMPLEQWLASVIKDDAALRGLDELLDIKR